MDSRNIMISNKLCPLHRKLYNPAVKLIRYRIQFEVLLLYGNFRTIGNPTEVFIFYQNKLLNC